MPTWSVFTSTPGNEATAIPIPTATSAAGTFLTGPGAFFHRKLSTIVTTPSPAAISACGFVTVSAISPGTPAMFSKGVPGALESDIG